MKELVLLWRVGGRGEGGRGRGGRGEGEKKEKKEWRAGEKEGDDEATTGDYHITVI